MPLRIFLLFLLSLAAVAQNPLRFDMGPSGAPTAPGFSAVGLTTTYSSTLGYGYLVPPARQYLRPAPLADVPSLLPEALIRDGHQSAADISFRVDLPSGSWHCIAYLGDLGSPLATPPILTPRERMDILVNGTPVVNDATARTLTRKASFNDLIGGYRRIHFLADAVNGQIVFQFHSDGLAPSLNCVMGLEIYPALEAPIAFDHQTRTLVAAPAYTTTLASGLSAFNSHNYAAARSAFDSVADPLARAWGYAWLLGWLQGEEADVDASLLDDAQALLAGLSQDDIRVAALSQDLDELELAHFYNQARGYPASILPGSLASIVQNLSAATLLFEQSDDDILGPADATKPERPLHSKMRFLLARNFYSRGTKISDPTSPYNQLWLGIFQSELGSALDIFPKSHTLRVFEFMASNYAIPGGLIKNWPGPSSLPALDPTTAWWAPYTEIAGNIAAPAWANAQRRYHLGFRRGGQWWMENRLIESAIGGGAGDDVEGAGLLGLASIPRSEHGVLENGVASVLSEVLFGPAVDQDQGYFAGCGDVEHAGEFTANPLFILMPTRYGDPRYIEAGLRCVRNADETADSAPWTQPLSGGKRSFLRYNFGANSICGPARDIPLNMRSIVPGFTLQDYNGSPRLVQIFEELARSWRDHAMSVAQNKPRGIFPQAVSTTGPLIFGTNGAWWLNGGYFNLPNGTAYHGYLYALLLSAYEKSSATNRHTFLQPIVSAGLLLEQLVSGTISGSTPGSAPWAADILGDVIADALAAAKSAIVKEQVLLGLTPTQLGRLDIAINGRAAPYLQYLNQPSTATKVKTAITTTFNAAADWQRYMWVLGTSSVTYTDRIYLMAMKSHQLLYSSLMGGGFSIAPTTAVSWANPNPGQGELDFAALVNDVQSDALDILYFNFESQAHPVDLNIWRRLSFGTWQLTIGNDTNQDDFIDGLPHTTQTVVIDSPGKVLHLPPMPAGVLQKIELRLITPSGAPAALVADPALNPDSLQINPAQGTLEFSVHNLGSSAFSGVSVEVREGGILVGSAAVPTLQAPLDLTPRSTVITMPYTAQTPAPNLSINLVLPVGLSQITDANDSFTASVSLPDPTLQMGPVTGYADFDLTLNAPFDKSNSYWIAVGISGDQPGFPLAPGLTLPLNYDAITSFALTAQTVFIGSIGTVSPSGQGLLQVRIPPTPGLSGTQVFFGATTAAATFRAVSNGLSFTLP